MAISIAHFLLAYFFNKNVYKWLIHVSPLDELIDNLGGTSCVAEMTGRRGRIVRLNKGNKPQYQAREFDSTNVDSLNIQEVVTFTFKSHVRNKQVFLRFNRFVREIVLYYYTWIIVWIVVELLHEKQLKWSDLMIMSRKIHVEGIPLFNNFSKIIFLDVFKQKNSFMNGEKFVAIISDAASTGSYVTW